MTTQTIDAVFEKGVFRVLSSEPLQLSDGQHVRLQIESKTRAQEILDAAAAVYDGLSEEEIDEIERIALQRDDFFGRSGSLVLATNNVKHFSRFPSLVIDNWLA